MKTIFKSGLIWMVITSILAGCGSSNNIYQSGAQTQVTYQTFYDDLSPYGTWIDYPDYGNVWTPNVDEDFRPYDTNGHWVYTDDGWAWASDYAWGWAPFHYGRWLYDDAYGWLWVPDYTWSPAWVTWGYVDDYYCWAPLMPGVDISLQFGTWRPPSFYWNACTRDHIYDRNLGAVSVRPEQLSTVANRISVINNFNTTAGRNAYYHRGPDVREVQKYVQPRIQPATIKDVHNITEVRHNGNEMNVYRPQIQDPKVIAQQHPKQVIQPKEFRRADGVSSKPIVRDEQRPVMHRPDQRTNVSRLPVFHPSNGNQGNNNGGGRRRNQ